MIQTTIPETRQLVFSKIKENPGISFRNLQRLTKHANGSLQYNLEKLMKNNQVKECKILNRTCYFIMGQETKKLTAFKLMPNHAEVIECLENGIESIEEISEKTGFSYSNIARKLSIYIKQELVESKHEKGKKTFSIINGVKK